MAKHTHTFASFAELSQYLKPEMRKQGKSLPKAKPFYPHLAFTVKLSIDGAIKSKKGVRIARTMPNGKIRSVNLSQNIARNYIETTGTSSIKVSGRNAITQVCSGLGVL